MTTALVTGASSGMGKATAKQLLADGYTVCAAARRLEKMEDLKALGARTLRMDITKEEDVQAVVQTITEEQGGVDVLVNNAGFAVYGPMEDVSPQEAHYQFEVNVFGLARITQLVLPYMREKGAMGKLEEELYFVVDERGHTIDLTQKGREKLACRANGSFSSGESSACSLTSRA